MSTSKKLCRFIHLPLQSGDDGILSRMHRRYTAAEYRDTVAYALDKIPRLGLGSDVITGFPGEDDAAFKNTFDMIESLPFSNLHIFPYSKRPGTEAALMSDQVQSSVAKNRSSQLLEIATRKKSEFVWRLSAGRASRVQRPMPSTGPARARASTAMRSAELTAIPA